MGRRNTSFYDDLLLQKTKAIFSQVIENLNVNRVIDNVEALSSQETIERWNRDSHLPSGSRGGPSRVETKWPVTFEQFVEHLDEQDEFVQHTAELLVSETLRTAIDRSIEKMTLAVYQTGTGPPLLRTDIGCTRDDQHSLRVRRGVERLTRSNRRNRSNVTIGSDSSSSSSGSSDSSDLNPEDFLPVGSVPRAPPSVLQGRTRRLARNSDAFEREMEEEARQDEEERAEMLRAMDRERERREMSAANSRASQYTLRRQRSGIIRRPSTPIEITEHEERPTPILPTSNLQTSSSTGSMVRRFLTEPLTYEGRTRSISRDDPVSLNTLSSIYGASASTQSSHPRLSSLLYSGPSTVAAEIGEDGDARREEFEAYATSRRYHRRSQSANRRREDDDTTLQRSSALNIDEQTASEDETFYRALGTLVQADETIRQVSQEAQEADSAAAATTRASARRFNLPPMSSERRVLRMPSRLARRYESIL